MDKEDILKEALKIKRIKKSGIGFSATFNKEDYPVYGEKLTRNMLLGVFGRTPVVDKYNSLDVYRIFQCVNECFVKIRSDYKSSDVSAIMHNFFMAACGVANEHTLRYIRRCHA